MKHRESVSSRSDDFYIVRKIYWKAIFEKKYDQR